jgi:hypothetical protein
MTRRWDGTSGTPGHPYRVVSRNVPPLCPDNVPDMSRNVPVPQDKVPQWVARASLERAKMQRDAASKENADLKKQLAEMTKDRDGWRTACERMSLLKVLAKGNPG